MKEENKENEAENLNINDPQVLEEFGKRIKKARNKKKISQESLGELLSITRQAISKWENGKSVPDISIWRKISEVLEVDLSDFVNMVDNSIKNNTNIETEIKNDDKQIKVVTEDKVLEDKKIINTQKEAINFYIDIKTLIIIFTLFVSLAIFFGTTFFIGLKKTENHEEREKNEWKQINLISSNEELSFIGYVIYDNSTSIYNFDNFFYNSSIVGTKKEPLIKSITTDLYIGNKEIYSYTYNKPYNRLQDFLDNISIAMTHEETFDDQDNLVIKLTLTKKDGTNTIMQIEVIPEK